MRRSAALDMLRQKAAAMPARPDKAKLKAEQDAVLDRTLRSTFQYLAEFAKELNGVTPVAGKPYEFIYLGKLPDVTVSDAFVDMRLKKIDGRDVCDHLIFRYRVTPDAAARATLLGPDIQRMQTYLGALRVPFEMKPETKDDFGKVTRALFTVNASLPCEAIVRGDYEEQKVLVEVTNVRRPGRMQCRMDPKVWDDVADDFARYVLGADDDFAKLFVR